MSLTGIASAFKSVVGLDARSKTREFKVPRDSSTSSRWILDFYELKSNALRNSLLEALSEPVPLPTILEGLAWENLVSIQGPTIGRRKLMRNMISSQSPSNSMNLRQD